MASFASDASKIEIKDNSSFYVSDQAPHNLLRRVNITGLGVDQIQIRLKKVTTNCNVGKINVSSYKLESMREEYNIESGQLPGLTRPFGKYFLEVSFPFYEMGCGSVTGPERIIYSDPITIEGLSEMKVVNDLGDVIETEPFKLINADIILRSGYEIEVLSQQ